MTSHWLKAVLTAVAIALPTNAPLAAQEALQLKAGKSWQHKHSEIIVPATLAGILRERGMAYAADDLDVGLSYTVGGAAESLTVYIFRNTNGAVPVWFAQAQWGHRKQRHLWPSVHCRRATGVRAARAECRVGPEGGL